MLIVCGSINADLVLRVDHLPRPGETVLTPGYTVVPGGKGANQAAAAAKAGASVRMVGRVGDDDHGRAMCQALAQAGVATDGIARADRPTGIAIIAVEPAGENSILVASGANLAVEDEQVPDSALSPGVTVLCQNEIPQAASFALIRRAHARGARTILNLAPASPLPEDVLRTLNLLLVNEVEAAAVVGHAGAPEALATDLARRFGLTCVVTLGGRGAIAATPSEVLAVGALAVEVVDTTGAGDTFSGVLAAALDRGLPLAPALREASVAGALACTALGAQASQPHRSAIEAHLALLPPPRRIA